MKNVIFESQPKYKVESATALDVWANSANSGGYDEGTLVMMDGTFIALEAHFNHDLME